MAYCHQVGRAGRAEYVTRRCPLAAAEPGAACLDEAEAVDSPLARPDPTDSQSDPRRRRRVGLRVPLAGRPFWAHRGHGTVQMTAVIC